MLQHFAVAPVAGVSARADLAVYPPSRMALTALGMVPKAVSTMMGESPPSDRIWKRWSVWQFADNARIPGIVGPVDLDVFCCSEAEFGALLGTDCGYVVMPIALGDTNPELDALTRALLARMDIDYPNDRVTDLEEIEYQGRTGYGFNFSRAIEGTGWRRPRADNTAWSNWPRCSSAVSS